SISQDNPPRGSGRGALRRGHRRQREHKPTLYRGGPSEGARWDSPATDLTVRWLGSVAIMRIPIATAIAGRMRRRATGSCKTTVAMSAALITLVSRSAETSASGALVWAQMTRP